MSILDKTARNFARGKQKALEKMDRTEKTTDAEYKEWKGHYESLYKQTEKLRTDMEAAYKALKEFSIAQSEICMHFQKMYDSTSPMYGSVNRNLDNMRLVDAERVRFEEEMNNNVITPTAKHLGQFKEIKDRIEIRDTRRLDMDRYARDVQVHTGNNHPEKAAKAQTKYENMSAAYYAVHQELIEDMRNLFHDRSLFLNPLLATHIVCLSQYYRGASYQMQQMLPFYQNIDRSAVHEHIWVISQVTSAKHKDEEKDGDSPRNRASSNAPNPNVNTANTTNAYQQYAHHDPTQPNYPPNGSSVLPPSHHSQPSSPPQNYGGAPPGGPGFAPRSRPVSMQVPQGGNGGNLAPPPNVRPRGPSVGAMTPGRGLPPAPGQGGFAPAPGQGGFAPPQGGFAQPPPPQRSNNLPQPPFRGPPGGPMRGPPGGPMRGPTPPQNNNAYKNPFDDDEDTQSQGYQQQPPQQQNFNQGPPPGRGLPPPPGRGPAPSAPGRGLPPAPGQGGFPPNRGMPPSNAQGGAPAPRARPMSMQVPQGGLQIPQDGRPRQGSSGPLPSRGLPVPPPGGIAPNRGLPAAPGQGGAPPGRNFPPAPSRGPPPAPGRQGPSQFQQQAGVQLGGVAQNAANNRQAQQAVGNQIASNSSNPVVRMAAKNSFVQRGTGAAVGSASNTMIQNQVNSLDFNQQQGYDQQGYDQQGYDQQGYDQQGYDQQQYYGQQQY